MMALTSKRIVYNSSGYEKVEAIEALDGIVDIFLPDFKYISSEMAARYSNAPDYPEIAKRALAQMVKQTGDAKFDERDMMKRALPFYQNCDCVVLPSYHEGMSNVLLEAAAVGRPIIASDIPGCREAVEHSKTGLLCRAKDADSLYVAMRAFLALSAEQKAALP